MLAVEAGSNALISGVVGPDVRAYVVAGINVSNEKIVNRNNALILRLIVDLVITV
jgi:hypothetical protein